MLSSQVYQVVSTFILLLLLLLSLFGLFCLLVCHFRKARSQSVWQTVSIKKRIDSEPCYYLSRKEQVVVAIVSTASEVTSKKGPRGVSFRIFSINYTPELRRYSRHLSKKGRI